MSRFKVKFGSTRLEEIVNISYVSSLIVCLIRRRW